MFPNKYQFALLAILALGTELTITDAEILETMTISPILSTELLPASLASSPSSISSLSVLTVNLSEPTDTIKSDVSADSVSTGTGTDLSTAENDTKVVDRLDTTLVSGGDSSVAIGVGSSSKREHQHNDASSSNTIRNNNHKEYYNNNRGGGMRMSLNFVTPPIYDPPTPPPSPSETVLSHSSSLPRHSSYPTVVTLSSLSVLSSLTSLSSSSSSSSFSSSTKMKSLKQYKSTMDTNVTVQLGNNAYLPCNVEQLIDKPVSWIRVRDGHILTVDHTQFIADERFQPIYQEQHQRWSLQIKYSQKHDMGLYECQVSTEPKRSYRVFLNVVVPKTELIGEYNRFVKAGSKVALHCIVRGSIEPPSYIIWFKGNQQIIQGNKQGWYMQIDREIFGNSSDQQNTIGSLIIPSVTKRDSGNYTCSPSNSAPVSVDLHVLNGEYSASAIMSSAVMNRQNLAALLLIVVATASGQS